MDYMEYAYLQTGAGREGEARARRADWHIARVPRPTCRPPTPSRRSRSRYALERRDWQAAAALDRAARSASPGEFPVGRGDDLVRPRARRGAIPATLAGAEAEIAKLQALREKLDEAKDTYWANQVEVQRLAAAGMLAHAQGDDKKAVELVRQAADLDATMDKHPATPAAVLPARELLADLLLEA